MIQHEAAKLLKLSNMVSLPLVLLGLMIFCTSPLSAQFSGGPGKGDNLDYARLTKTIAADQITGSGARISASVFADLMASSRGVCYSEASAPVIEGLCVAAADTASFFEVVLTGLAQSTSYVARSYLSYNGDYIYGNEITFVTASSSMVNQGYDAGWNMVSVPVQDAGSYYTSLFPTATLGTLYSFSDIYMLEDTLSSAQGEGYWIRLDEADSVSFTGENVTSLMLDLQEGWNMIGSVSSSGSLQDPSGLVVPGTLYGFDGIYALANGIEPGRGYWVALQSAGEVEVVETSGEGSGVMLSGGDWLDLVVAPTTYAPLLNDVMSGSFDVMNVYDGERLVRSLYFGGTLDGEYHPLQLTLPPLPPSGILDVRMAGGRWLQEAVGFDVGFGAGAGAGSVGSGEGVAVAGAGSVGSGEGVAGAGAGSVGSGEGVAGAGAGAGSSGAGSSGAGADAVSGSSDTSGDGNDFEPGVRVELRQGMEPVQLVFLASGDQEKHFRLHFTDGLNELGSVTAGSGERIDVPADAEVLMVISLADLQDGEGSEQNDIPVSYSLQQNYPNPFNPTTWVRYALPEVSDVRLEVFSLLGQRVALLADVSGQAPGTYELMFDASGLSSGIYVYRLTAGSFVQTRKMLLTK